MAETVDEYLARSLIKDNVKGGGGWRSTSEIAKACDFASPKMPNALRAMRDAEANGLVTLALDGRNWLARTTRSLSEARDLHPNYLP